MKQKRTNKRSLRFQIIILYILFGFVIILAIFTSLSLILTFTSYERFDKDEYMALYEENITKEEVEASANEGIFLVPETIEVGKHTTLNLDNVGYQTWKTRQKYEYYYLPFLSYQPGLYTMVITSNDDLNFEAINQIEDDSTPTYHLDESLETTLYNIYLKPTTIIKVMGFDQVDFTIELIPQDDYIKYQNDLNKFGAYPVGTSIEAGNYDLKLSDPDDSLFVFDTSFFTYRHIESGLVSLIPGDVLFITDEDVHLTKSDESTPEEDIIYYFQE